ncbi:MAG: fatty acid desaturase [Caulobacteraceae bacterium]|nr:fatty acid desaturase [Caulobacteraceae bacterium]
MDVATLVVAALVYGGWIGLTLLDTRLSLLVSVPLGAWLIAWQGSLQHETIHGHPTPWPWANRLLGFAPLNLWLPYERYRRLHLAHHAATHLTLPGDDPESRYLAADRGVLGHLGGRATSTLAGRLLLGPAIEVGGFLASESRAVLAGEARARRDWAVHLAAVAVIWAWLRLVCGLELGRYLATFVYPGAALSLLRSFAEHRADPDPARRIAVVEKAPILGLLFLNNNLHAVHHAFPGASWRRLPALYADHRAVLLKANGGLVYHGYAEVARRYLFRPHDVLVHPAQSDATAQAAAIQGAAP